MTKLLVIYGRVQGVFYRAWTVETATRLGVSGWVRNRINGTVEALLDGPEDMVNQLIEACKEGPSGAEVHRIDVTDAVFDGESGFIQKPTE